MVNVDHRYHDMDPMGRKPLKGMEISTPTFLQYTATFPQLSCRLTRHFVLEAEVKFLRVLQLVPVEFPHPRHKCPAQKCSSHWSKPLRWMLMDTEFWGLRVDMKSTIDFFDGKWKVIHTPFDEIGLNKKNNRTYWNGSIYISTYVDRWIQNNVMKTILPANQNDIWMTIENTRILQKGTVFEP